MKYLYLFIVLSLCSFTANAQVKESAKPEIGYEAFVKNLTDSVVFPQEYYDSSGLNLRIAVDSLAKVKLMSIKPQNTVFFDEIKQIVESLKWVPQKIDGVSKTSVFVLPIKLSKEMQENVFKKAEPVEGIPIMMQNFMRRLNLGVYETNTKFVVTLFISKTGDVTSVQCVPHDENIYLQVKDYFLKSKWFPAVSNGVPVDSTFKLPITVKINSNSEFK